MFGIGEEGPDPRSLELVMLPRRDQLPDPRPIRRFHPAWMYCRVHNSCDEPLFVYGPRHHTDATTMPTSLFLLPPGQSTPKRWDCKGILISSDRVAINGRPIAHGPVVLKYRDMRRVTIAIRGGVYQCPHSNGVRTPSDIDFAVPAVSYRTLLELPRRAVTL